MCNLMVDLETMGTRPGSVILAIAAVPFMWSYDIEPFYVKISKEDSIRNGFTVDESTMLWWEKQSEEARNEAFSGTTSIESALYAFTEYYRSFGVNPTVWGKGADFDNVLLSEAYNRLGLVQPWKYTDSRCYRTLQKLFPQVPYIAPKIKHNALQDAMAQAQHAARILHWMNP